MIKSDARILVELIDQLGYKISLNDMRSNILKYKSLANHKSWVALKDKKIVGCISGAITISFHKKGSFFRVSTLIVDKDNRREGVGLELMKKAESYAKEKKCCHIELTSGSHRSKVGSHNFYKKLRYSNLNKIKEYFAKKIN